MMPFGELYTGKLPSEVVDACQGSYYYNKKGSRPSHRSRALAGLRWRDRFFLKVMQAIILLAVALYPMPKSSHCGSERWSFDMAVYIRSRDANISHTVLLGRALSQGLIATTENSDVSKNRSENGDVSTPSSGGIAKHYWWKLDET
jgi:hypothetical protein